jgi:hypothetical protein
MEQPKRGLTIFFNDGSKLSMDFPGQSPNEAAAALKIDDVLKKRLLVLEADSTCLMIPFDNVRYIQLYPAPKTILNHTYIRGAVVHDH